MTNFTRWREICEQHFSRAHLSCWLHQCVSDCHLLFLTFLFFSCFPFWSQTEKSWLRSSSWRQPSSSLLPLKRLLLLDLTGWFRLESPEKRKYPSWKICLAVLFWPRCVDMVKSSQYVELANDLEINKAITYLRQKDFNQVSVWNSCTCRRRSQCGWMVEYVESISIDWQSFRSKCHCVAFKDLSWEECTLINRS